MKAASCSEAIHAAESSFNIDSAYSAVRRKFPQLNRLQSYQKALEVLFADIRKRVGTTVERETAYTTKVTALAAQYDRFSWYKKRADAEKRLKQAREELERNEYDLRLSDALGETKPAGDISLPSQRRLIASIEQELKELPAQEESVKHATTKAVQKFKATNPVLAEVTEYFERRREYYTESAEKERAELDRVAAAMENAYRD